MLKIWRSIGRALGSVPGEIKKEFGGRGIAALWVAIIGFLVLTSYFVWDGYASKGCSVELPFWEAVGKGLAALIMGIFISAVGGVCIGILMYVPSGVKAAVEAIQEKREERRYYREQGIELPKRPPGTVRRWILFFGTLAAVVVGLGFAVGYIAWMIVC